MGTRAYVKIREGDRTFAGIYLQNNGCPYGYVSWFLKYLARRTRPKVFRVDGREVELYVTNGIVAGELFTSVNGPDDFAATFITFAKLHLLESYSSLDSLRDDIKKAPNPKIPAGGVYVVGDVEDPSELVVDYVYYIDLEPVLSDGVPIGWDVSITVYHYGEKKFEGSIGEYLKKFSSE